MFMGCHFCKCDKWDVYYDDRYSEYSICLDCWREIPKYISDNEQRWKLIQMRGDILSATL